MNQTIVQGIFQTLVIVERSKLNLFLFSKTNLPSDQHFLLKKICWRLLVPSLFFSLKDYPN